MADFIPPQFSKFGKSVGDLFKKQYDYGSKISTIHKADGGIKVEAGGSSKGNSTDLTGYAKVNYKDSSFGESEFNVSTNGSVTGSVTLKNLGEGVEVVVKGSDKPCGTISATYAQDFFAGSACLNNSYKLGLAGVIGHDGVSVGATVDLDLAGDISNPLEYGIGTQYQQSDYTATLLTSQKGETLSASWFQKISDSFSIGTKFTFQPEKNARMMCFASKYELDANTTVKAKASTCGTVAGSIQHRLKDPALKFGLAASFDSKNSFANKDFGINLTFGDF